MLFGHLALTAAALFTGAAFYVNLAEQPARPTPATRALLMKWNGLHAVRTVLGALAITAFIFALNQ
jgi:hypothetical protein